MKITVTPGKVRRTLEALGQITTADKVLQSQLTPEQAAAIADLYPAWEVGQEVAVDMIRRYQGSLYKCVQAHTTQADWTPPETPALWSGVVANGVIPQWVQPTGAHDAYALGDQVEHNDKVWESDIDANVWEPPEQWTEVV